MPEGDTIHKLAGALRPWLVGRRLRQGRVAAQPTLALTGRTVTAVGVLGKHLFIDLQDGLVLRSHLGLHGTWHRYGPGEPWLKPARHASLVLETEQDVLVCFHAREVELLEGHAVRAFELRRRLGPDVVAAAPAAETLVRRARSILDPGAPLIDVLLEQRVASGIGNVYKSEVLFLERLHPLTAWTHLDPRSMASLYATAHELLSANLGGGPRVTRAIDDGAGRLWVYRRGGQPCLECTTPIESARMGRGLRSCYWCPRCQPETAAGESPPT